MDQDVLLRLMDGTEGEVQRVGVRLGIQRQTRSIYLGDGTYVGCLLQSGAGFAVMRSGAELPSKWYPTADAALEFEGWERK